MDIIPTNVIWNTGMYNSNIIIHCGMFNRSLSMLFYWFKSTLIKISKALNHARHYVNAKDFCLQMQL